MHSLEEHVMELEKVHPSGAEEWFCPTCGRRFLLSWPPDYEKVILDPGNESAIHNGGKAGVRMQRPGMRVVEDPVLSDEIRSELEMLLEEIDIDGQLGPVD